MTTGLSTRCTPATLSRALRACKARIKRAERVALSRIAVVKRERETLAGIEALLAEVLAIRAGQAARQAEHDAPVR